MKKVLLLLIPISLMFAGCVSDAPVVTGFSTGLGGYSINLMISSRNIPYGGNATVMAVVKDPSGVTVNDPEIVFSSKLGGVFTDNFHHDGLATAIYTAPDVDGSDTPSIPVQKAHISNALPIQDQVSASYRGSFTGIDIMLFNANINMPSENVTAADPVPVNAETQGGTAQ